MKNFFLILIAGFLSSVALSQTTGTIRGVVTDAQSKEPVPFTRISAEMEIPDSSKSTVSTTTNMEGEFVFRYLGEGNYTVRAFFPDYTRQSIRHIPVKKDLSSHVIISLSYKKGNNDPEEVYIYTAPRNRDNPNIVREEYTNTCGDKTGNTTPPEIKNDTIRKPE